jgi:hypothetical protein
MTESTTDGTRTTDPIDSARPDPRDALTGPR